MGGILQKFSPGIWKAVAMAHVSLSPDSSFCCFDKLRFCEDEIMKDIVRKSDKYYVYAQSRPITARGEDLAHASVIAST